MPQLISISAQSSNRFDTLISSVFDFGNIQDSFIFYHYGITEYGQEPGQKSIHQYLKNSKTISIEIESLISSASALNQSSGSAFYDSQNSLNEIISYDVVNKIERVGKNIYLYFNNQSSTYTPSLSDHNKMIVFNSSNESFFLVPDDSEINFPIGSNIKIFNKGSENVIVSPKNSCTIRGEKDYISNNESLLMYKRLENDWVIIQ